jgi:beta-glucanase (GH16 family)
MALRRPHRLAQLIVVVIALAVGLTAPASATAGAPSVSYRVSGADLLTVSGRTATASPVVRIKRATRSGWILVRRVRAHHHRFSTTVTLAAGTTATLRVTSNRRSRTFRVTMPAAKKPTTAPVPVTTYDACGAQPRKPDGTSWSCAFQDDFDGSSLDRAKWLPQTVFSSGSPGAYACYADDPSVVDVANGSLNLTVRQVSAPVSCEADGKTISTSYLAGMVTTYHLFSQQYGRFEARIRNTATSAPGLHEAFWLWPDDRVASTEVWPNAGEIDVSETYSGSSGLSIPFLHYSADSGGPQPGVNTAWDCAASRGQWNTYTLVWSPTSIEIVVNGRTCLVNTSADPAFQKPYIVAFTEGLGAAGNEYDGRAPLPATMNVDYLRVWR